MIAYYSIWIKGLQGGEVLNYCNRRLCPRSVWVSSH